MVQVTWMHQFRSLQSNIIKREMCLGFINTICFRVLFQVRAPCENYLALRYISHKLLYWFNKHNVRNITSGNTQKILKAPTSRNQAHLSKVCLYFQVCRPTILANLAISISLILPLRFFWLSNSRIILNILGDCSSDLNWWWYINMCTYRLFLWLPIFHRCCC